MVLKLLNAVVWVVTPCVGVWIEIIYRIYRLVPLFVTPCVGVWIEMAVDTSSFVSVGVTPCVGVWIEIVKKALMIPRLTSLPVWECGLK